MLNIGSGRSGQCFLSRRFLGISAMLDSESGKFYENKIFAFDRQILSVFEDHKLKSFTMFMVESDITAFGYLKL